MPRTESGPKRATLGKLQKDFERLKVSVQSISSESSLVKVSLDGVSNDTFSRTEGFSGPDKIQQNSVDSSKVLKQDLQLKPLMQGREVDEAIMEERERDIQKINKDLLLVNEMFKLV